MGSISHLPQPGQPAELVIQAGRMGRMRHQETLQDMVALVQAAHLAAAGLPAEEVQAREFLVMPHMLTEPVVEGAVVHILPGADLLAARAGTAHLVS